MRLDGRDFEGLTQALTARQNDYVTVNLRISGATEILATFTKDDTPETRQTKAQEAISRILESGRKYKIIAGILTEKGKTWTREEADRNADIFADTREVDEQNAMNSQLLEMVVAFFSYGEAYSTTSPKSSSQNSEAPATSSAGVETMENSVS